MNAEGLSLELLALVAKLGGPRDARVMREVSKDWQAGFEMSISHLRFNHRFGGLPSARRLGQRFPSLTSLDIGETTVGDGWLGTLRYLRQVATLTLGHQQNPELFPRSLASRLTTHSLHCLYRSALPLTCLDLQVQLTLL